MVGSEQYLPFSYGSLFDVGTCTCYSGQYLICNEGQWVKGLKIDVTFGVLPLSGVMRRVQNLMISKNSGDHSFKGPLLRKLCSNLVQGNIFLLITC